MSPHLRVAVEAAQEAGRLARRRLLSDHRPNPDRKELGELVTETDRDAEELIMNIVLSAFPQHGFFGEESGMRPDADGGDRQCWVVDPLDGTTNFVHGIPACAVSIAYCQDRRPVAAAVCDVAADEVYSAELGRGAYVENRRIRVSPVAAPGDALILAGGQLTDSRMWPMLAALSPRVSAIRRAGATALDFAWLARGRGDGMVCGPVKYWDVAAGALILREAGGLLSRLDGETEFAFGEPAGPFVAATPKLTPFLLNAAREWESRRDDSPKVLTQPKAPRARKGTPS